MKALFYGDNLQVLRDSIATESVDLIYLDLPFTSKATYNVRCWRVSRPQFRAAACPFLAMSGILKRISRHSQEQKAVAGIDTMKRIKCNLTAVCTTIEYCKLDEFSKTFPSE